MDNIDLGNRVKEYNRFMESGDFSEVMDNKVKNSKSTHYELWSGFEAIDVSKMILNKQEYIGALKFNILKYQLRLGKKDSIESDMEKIQDYKRELDSILQD